MKVDNLIIGGGLAGTTVAVCLKKRGENFLLIESSDRLGGKIDTQRSDEATLEFGPNSFTNQTEEIFTLLTMLGLEAEIIPADEAAKKRYILKRGKIKRLPGKPPEILTTRSLSLMGRLRFLREIFYVPPKPAEEESVHAFFARHFGREVADYFADPFVSGVYAGDAKKLSLKDAFPTMADAETQAKSLIRYLIRSRKTDKATPQTFQLKQGLVSIFERAHGVIGEEGLRLKEAALTVKLQKDVAHIMTDQGEYEAKHLYLTSPAYVSAHCLEQDSPEIAQILASIEYAPVASIHVRLPKTEDQSFDGFGMLIPSVEKRRILGVLYNSSTFPSLFGDRDHHYLTVFVGGAHRPDLVEHPDDTLKSLVSEELKSLFPRQKRAEILNIRKYERAIPQYHLGYGKVMAALCERLADSPSLRLAGNYLGGISIPKTVAYAMGLPGLRKS